MAVALPASGVFAATPAYAEPGFHEVRYTVTADGPTTAGIYYRDTEPATFVDYSHNPYLFTPMVRATVGPGQPWVLSAGLADPSSWAMVVASAESPGAPTFRCELAVDGVVVASASGPRGALCSIRTW